MWSAMVARMHEMTSDATYPRVLETSDDMLICDVSTLVVAALENILRAPVTMDVRSSVSGAFMTSSCEKRPGRRSATSSSLRLGVSPITRGRTEEPSAADEGASSTASKVDVIARVSGDLARVLPTMFKLSRITGRGLARREDNVRSA